MIIDVQPSVLTSLDGLPGNSYLRADASDTASGNDYSFLGNIGVTGEGQFNSLRVLQTFVSDSGGAFGSSVTFSGDIYGSAGTLAIIDAVTVGNTLTVGSGLTVSNNNISADLGYFVARGTSALSNTLYTAKPSGSDTIAFHAESQTVGEFTIWRATNSASTLAWSLKTSPTAGMTLADTKYVKTALQVQPNAGGIYLSPNPYTIRTHAYAVNISGNPAPGMALNVTNGSANFGNAVFIADALTVTGDTTMSSIEADDLSILAGSIYCSAPTASDTYAARFVKTSGTNPLLECLRTNTNYPAYFALGASGSPSVKFGQASGDDVDTFRLLVNSVTTWLAQGNKVGIGSGIGDTLTYAVNLYGSAKWSGDQFYWSDNMHYDGPSGLLGIGMSPTSAARLSITTSGSQAGSRYVQTTVSGQDHKLHSWEVTVGNISAGLSHEGQGIELDITKGTSTYLTYTGFNVHVAGATSTGDNVEGYSFWTTSPTGVSIGLSVSGTPGYTTALAYRTRTPQAAIDIRAGLGKEAAYFDGNVQLANGNMTIPSGYRVTFGGSVGSFIIFSGGELAIYANNEKVMGWSEV